MLAASRGRLIPGSTPGRPAPVGWSTGGSQVKNLFSSSSVVAEPGVVSKAYREGGGGRERERERNLVFSVLRPVNHYGYIRQTERENSSSKTQKL